MVCMSLCPDSFFSAPRAFPRTAVREEDMMLQERCRRMRLPPSSPCVPPFQKNEPIPRELNMHIFNTRTSPLSRAISAPNAVSFFSSCHPRRRFSLGSSFRLVESSFAPRFGEPACRSREGRSARFAWIPAVRAHPGGRNERGVRRPYPGCAGSEGPGGRKGILEVHGRK